MKVLLIIGYFLLLVMNWSECFNCSKSAMCQKELETMRIEEIKSNILNELGMIEPPRLAGIQKPSPEMRKHYQRMVENSDEFNSEEDYDILFFPAEDPSAGEDESSLVAKFDLSDKLQSFELIEAKLSVFINLPSKVVELPEIDVQVFRKNLDGSLDDQVVSHKVSMTRNQRISISIPTDEVMRWQSTDPIEGLFVMAKYEGRNVAVHPQQSSSEVENMLLQLTVSDNKSRRRRNKRDSIPVCLRGSPVGGCCLYDLVVTFDDIGWDWIISPTAYNAYVCQGDCSIISHHNKDTEMMYSSVLKASNKAAGGKEKHLKSLGICCHPTDYDNLRIVFLNREGHVTISSVPGMVAKKCSCS